MTPQAIHLILGVAVFVGLVLGLAVVAATRGIRHQGQGGKWSTATSVEEYNQARRISPTQSQSDRWV